ncbi:MAG: hypothetical protein HKN79_09155 [Flavobacteriales bacterium]|nr:hypothetical protein [Flavobacteriales bacterium]
MRALGLPLLNIVFFITLAAPHPLAACSMYKISAGGKTMVGCNEDAWRTDSKIWFENAPSAEGYGAAYTGSREVSAGRFAPQSGMNTAGLVFSRLAAYYPDKGPVQHKKPVYNEIDYLTGVMQQCATVEEVREFIEDYDRSFFIDDVFIYIDPSGKYLVVEPYGSIMGEEANYVLSNFCPSITQEEEANRLSKYRKGKAFLERNSAENSLEYCRSLSDTMHVCRSRNGDGTLLTSIWDTENLQVHLYFYHDYDTSVQLDLNEELAKGDHMIDIPSLFPENEEFMHLAEYITPFNTPLIRVGLAFIGGLLLLLGLGYAILLLKYRRWGFLIPMALINGILFAYLFVLATNVSIYYFDAPYTHHSSNLISLSSYSPFLLLLAIIPLLYSTRKGYMTSRPRKWIRALVFSNHAIFLLLIFCFSYWGLYHFWV